MKKVFPFFLISIIAFCSCAPNPYKASNKIYNKKAAAFSKVLKENPVDKVVADSLKIPGGWIGTTNFGMRKPNIVIIHHTAQNSCEQTLKTFTTDISQVSAHYVICKDGTLHHMLNDYLRAWHAGASRWGNNTDINSSSIGIEIDNNGKEAFTEAQLNTLLGLLDTLKRSYNIPTQNFIGHSDIAPGRKVDPNVTFPWKRLSDKGFGLWYADTTALILPNDFNALYALKIIGYDIRKPEAATEAFRLHFLSIEKTGEMDDAEKKVLYLVMQKFL